MELDDYLDQPISPGKRNRKKAKKSGIFLSVTREKREKILVNIYPHLNHIGIKRKHSSARIILT